MIKSERYLKASKNFLKCEIAGKVTKNDKAKKKKCVGFQNLDGCILE